MCAPISAMMLFVNNVPRENSSRYVRSEEILEGLKGLRVLWRIEACALWASPVAIAPIEMSRVRCFVILL